MPRKRTGNVLWESDHYVARVATTWPDNGKRVRVHLDKTLTKEQAQAEALRLSADPQRVAEIIKAQKRTKASKAIARSNRLRAEARKRKLIKPKLHGKSGRMLRTEKGRAVFHQHVVATLIEKTAREVVKGRKRADVYDIKGCDGTDPIVKICDVMRAQLVSTPLQYATEACE